MYLIDKSIRKNTAHRQAMVLTKTLENTFKGLLKVSHIQSFREVKQTFQKEYFIFHVEYECLIKYLDDSKKILFLFDLDIRDSSEKVLIEKFSTSNRSKFLLSSTFEQQMLFEKLRKRILQWKSGMRDEMVFLEFLTDLKKTYERINRIYKTGDHDDKKNGVDFGVVLLTRPYYEGVEIKFNLKSSLFYLDKHKARYPNIGTFLFKNNIDLASPENKNMLTRRFIKFLLRSSQSKQAVHM